MILLDTSGVLAALDESDRHHANAVAALASSRPPRLLSPFVLAELDYLLTNRVSPTVAQRFLRDVADGAYQLEPFDNQAVAEALEILEDYPTIGASLADLSIVVLARRYESSDVLTLDERHFRVLRADRRRPFRLLPSDA